MILGKVQITAVLVLIKIYSCRLEYDESNIQSVISLTMSAFVFDHSHIVSFILFSFHR